MLSVKLFWLVFFVCSVQSKHRNSLFRYRSETTETNYFETTQNKPKTNRKSPKFPEKIPKYAPY
jgi:hypothetical protein